MPASGSDYYVIFLIFFFKMNILNCKFNGMGSLAATQSGTRKPFNNN